MEHRKKLGRPPIRVMITKPWHEEYINLLSDPQDKRSNADFFRELQIDETTFYRWLRKFREEIYEEANRRLKLRRGELRIKGWKRLEDMFDDKHGGAVLKALELFFKLNGDLVERVESRTEVLTPEQKKEKLAKFLSEIASKQGVSHDEEMPSDEPQEAVSDGTDEASGGQGTPTGEDSSDSGEQGS